MLRKKRNPATILSLMSFTVWSSLAIGADAVDLNPYGEPCFRGLTSPMIGASPNALSVMSGRVPAETPEQKALKKNYDEYQREFNACLARNALGPVSPMISAMHEQLKKLTAAQPLLTPTQTKFGGKFLELAYSGSPIMPWVSGTLGYYYSRSDAEYKRVKESVTRELRRKLIEAAESGEPPEQVRDGLLAAIRSGKALGSNVVSPEAAQLAADVTGDLREEYRGVEALRSLGNSPSKVLTKDQSAKEMAQAGKAAVQKRKAEREKYAAMLEAQRTLYEELKKSGASLNDQGLWKVEKERLGDLSEDQKLDLIKRYRVASAEARQSDTSLLKLAGLSDEAINGLESRSLLRKKATDVATTTSYYAESFKGALNFTNNFDIGGPDLRRALALGSLMSESVVSGAQILAAAATPTPVLVFQFIGLAGNFAGGMNGLFGGGGGPDPFQEQFAKFQEALFSALNALSAQVSEGFQMTSKRFDQIERHLDVVLVTTAAEFIGQLGKCREIIRDFGGRFEGSMTDIEDALVPNARYLTLAGCYEALHRDQALDQSAPSVYQTQVQLGIGRAIEPFSPKAEILRNHGEEFLAFQWPEAIFLYADLIDSRKALDDTSPTDDHLIGSFDLLTQPSATVADLREKLSLKVSSAEAARDVGPIISIYLGSEGRKDWRLDRYLRTHIEPRSTLIVLGALNATSHVLRVTEKSFKPIPERDQSTRVNQTVMRDRDEESYGLLIDYLPVALNVLAQESLISGDPIAPNVSNYLGAGDCGVGTDVQGSTEDQKLAARRKKAACILVREAPLLASNVGMVRLREAYETRKGPAWALGYEYALGESTDWALREVLGDMEFRRLVDASSPKGESSAWYLKLAGKCDGISRSDEVGMICEGGACNAPGSERIAAQKSLSADDRRKTLLNVCVVTKLPGVGDLEAGIFLHTNSVYEALNIAAGMNRKLRRRIALQATPEIMRPLIAVRMEEIR